MSYSLVCILNVVRGRERCASQERGMATYVTYPTIAHCTNQYTASSHRTPSNEFAKLKRAESSRFHHQARGSVVGAHKVQLTGLSPQDEEKRLQEVFGMSTLNNIESFETVICD